MERIVDLDLAAARIAVLVPGWRAAGPAVSGPTWRDAAASWPAPLLTDRALAADPDSVGLVVEDPRTGSVLQAVLFRGGWADVEGLLVHGERDAEVVVFPANGITGEADFAARLSGWAAEVFRL
ncbi:hypothetical protein [Kitasatospora sp. NPDC101183]|uniref:hypothetical protein n=1 Tax=Kitasatospora sp. NPDC101183 TaxID=3364100 RepID=UPI003820DBB3